MSTLQDVDAVRRAPVALDVVTSAKKAWLRDHRRPAALTAREALAALQFEMLFVWTCAAGLRNGVELSDADFQRLTTSCRWGDMLADEVLR